MELPKEMINRIEEEPSEAALAMLKKGYPTERVMAATGLTRAGIMKLIQPWIPDYVTQGLIPALLEIKAEDRKEGELWGKVKIMQELGFSHEQITEKIGLSGDALLDIQQKIKTETNPKVSNDVLFMGHGFVAPRNEDGTYNFRQGYFDFRAISIAEGEIKGITQFLLETGATIGDVCRKTGMRKEVILLIKWQLEFEALFGNEGIK